MVRWVKSVRWVRLEELVRRDEWVRWIRWVRFVGCVRGIRRVILNKKKLDGSDGFDGSVGRMVYPSKMDNMCHMGQMTGRVGRV